MENKECLEVKLHYLSPISWKQWVCEIETLGSNNFPAFYFQQMDSLLPAPLGNDALQIAILCLYKAI